MCGILGGSKPDWNFASALKSMRSRGPDSQQISRHTDLTLGFVRLAVRDLSPNADQPMTDQTTGQVRIVFNGELYGYETVRQQLLESGFQFRGTSDTEVALNAYLHWGPNFVERIDGMFALAIHDDRTKQLHLYRDRAGIKPLYYLHQGQRIAFGSELNAIESLIDDQSLTVDETALYDFAVLGYIPAPKSVYREVQQLQPAYRRSIDVRTGQTLYHGAYWKLPVEADSRITPEQAQVQVRALLNRSVTEQLQADVPVGCFLSGGIDSSIVAAEASVGCPGLPSFCLHFSRSPQSEAGFARQVADRLQLNHHQFDFRRIDDPASELIRLYHEPFLDTSAFPTAQISAHARQHVTVALGGDGGDELFGGYKWYGRYRSLSMLNLASVRGSRGTRLRQAAVKIADRLSSNHESRSVRRRLGTAILAAAADPVELYAACLGCPGVSERVYWRNQLQIPDDYDDFHSLRQFWKPQLPLTTRLQYVDFHTYLPDDILKKVDRASMQDSLEVRVPFLKRELIEFAFRLPEQIRLPRGQAKGLLKQAYQQLLPTGILRRRKKGFSIPLQHQATGQTTLRAALLRTAMGDDHHENRISIGFRDSVAQGEQYPGDANVLGIHRRGA